LLSPADMLILGAAALLFFGPDQLPKVARRAGHVMRDIQSTSQSFIREMERAADEAEFKENAARVEPVPHVAEPPMAEPVSEPSADAEMHAAEPSPAEPVKSEQQPPEKVSGLEV
jgi:Sec-independent protein translocase protein TatA